jgi:hypothetical protein
MKYRSFEVSSLKTVGDALEIAEDRIANFYKFSLGQWKRHHYDIRTMANSCFDHITPYAFALLNKCARVIEGHESKTRNRDFYLIHLQDHHILKALGRDHHLKLLPLLVYVFTHELIHIVRFCNFSQRFEISGKGRESEERLVHTTTYEILRDLSLPSMEYILESYQGHRACDLVAS